MMCPSGVDASQVAEIGTTGEAVVILSTTEATLLEADQVIAHSCPLLYDLFIMREIDGGVNLFRS
jgi:hypothetical protein